MRQKFPTREELLVMPVQRLRLLDITDKDEEDLVQSVLNQKEHNAPLMEKLNIIVPDIKTKEQEDHWQKIIDEKTAQIRASSQVKEITPDDDIPPLDIPSEAVESPVANETPESDNTPVVNKFCEFCDSKGVRHKKGCPTLTFKV